MEFERLRTFVILAENKNFSKTAEIQNVVQSTITSRIQELEKDLGRCLFIRNKQKVELSLYGKVFLPYVERILSLYDEGKINVNMTEAFEGRFIVGSVDSIWRNVFILSPILKEYVLKYPKISIRATTGHSKEIIQLLLDGIIDVAISYQHPRLNKFKVYVCYEDDFVLVVHPDHPLAARKCIRVEELPFIDLLYHDWGGSFNKWIDKIFPAEYVFKTQVDPAYIIVSLVKQGLGPAILTRSAVITELESKSLVEVPLVGRNLPPKWNVYLSVNINKINEFPVKCWLDLMEKFGLGFKQM